MNKKLIIVFLIITLMVGSVLAKQFDKDKIEKYLRKKIKEKSVKANKFSEDYNSSHIIVDIELDDVPYKFITSQANYDEIIE